MNYIDHRFMLLSSVYLAGWKESGNGVYKFRCPFCGDSKKTIRKTRGYFYPKDDSVSFKCHNCGAAHTLIGFLRQIAPDLATQFRYEKFVNWRAENPRVEKPEIKWSNNTAEKLSLTRNVLRDCTRLFSLDSDHSARQYLDGRLIPREEQRKLFYTKDINDFAKKIPAYKDRWFPRSKAIIIPFYDEDGALEYCQCRDLDPNASVRYFTFEINEGQKIWGQERVDWNQRVFLMEGPFDAMFVNNGLAVAGASLLSAVKYVGEKAKAGFTLVFDRDYQTNPEVFLQFKKAVDRGLSVVMYDKRFTEKDINDAITNLHWSQSALNTYLRERSFSGLAAKLELSSFKHPIKEGDKWQSFRLQKNAKRT